MRAPLERVRVQCESCGWSGGRAVSGAADRPCFRCGGLVAVLGRPYVEMRVVCGCGDCGWWGERAPSRTATACPRCEVGTTQRVRLVLDDGRELVPAPPAPAGVAQL